MAANGKLTINRSRSQSRIPFLLTAKITGGTGSFAGATGSYRLQGNFNPLAGNSLNVQLRGTIVTHTEPPKPPGTAADRPRRGPEPSAWCLMTAW